MRARVVAWVALGGVAYITFLAATVPASFVAARVFDQTQGAVQVSDAKGTLWRGEAKARVVVRRGSPVDVDALAWSFRPARLASGRLAFEVRARASGVDASLEAARGFGGWHAREALVRGDASGLSAFAPILATLRPTGSITLAARQLDWDGETLRGEATLEWRGATVALSEVRPIGAYRAQLRAAQGPAQFAISTLEGPLRVTGQGTLGPAARLAFSGEARADAAQAKALEPLMTLMGPRRPDGAHTLEWRH